MDFSDLNQLEKLMELMTQQGVSKLSLGDAAGNTVSIDRTATVLAAPASTILSSAAAVPQTAAPAVPTILSGDTDVTAPVVGVFYAAPAPDAAPYVQVGDRVKKGDVLCIIEAMKLMNEVTAERDGEITEILASNGDLVEYGQRLMRMDTDGQ